MSGETLGKFEKIRNVLRNIDIVRVTERIMTQCLLDLDWIKAEYKRLEKIVEEHDKRILGDDSDIKF